MTRVAAALILLIFALGVQPAWPQAARGRVRGHVIDTSNLPLPGVTITLTETAPGASPHVTVTNETGVFEVDVPYGRYTLIAELPGFEKATRPEFVLADALLTIDLTLSLAGFTEETQVIGQVPRLMSSGEPNAPATVDKDVIKIAPVQGLRYDSALPLLPTAVRGPDGMVALNGARANQGTVLVDRMRESDPITGEPSVTVPIAAIDTVQVFAPAPPAELGPGSAGVAAINSRRGADVFGFTVSTFVPRPRFGGGRSAVNGIESWQPNFGVDGPLVKGRAWFLQAVEYRWERFQNQTPSGLQDAKMSAFSSFTRLDVRAGAALLTGRVSLAPENRSHEGVDAFHPAATVPDVRSRPVSAAVVARLPAGEGTIELGVHVKDRRLDVTPLGDLPYLVGHTSVQGSFYRTAHSSGRRVEGQLWWNHAFTRFGGQHLLRAGASASRATVNGRTTSRPVTYLRSDGTVATRIEFAGNGELAASASAAGAFVQDSWSVRKNVTLDAGVRFDYSGGVGDGGVWPRAGITYDIDGRTKVAAGGGVFAGRATLNALTFSQRQARRISEFDPSGTSILTSALFIPETRPLALARAEIAYLQVDRTISRDWTLRASLLVRRGINEKTVAMVAGDAGTALVLGSNGESRGRSVEVTAAYRSPHASRQLFVSYVRSATSGNLNDLETVVGPATSALIHPDARGPLAADVPHRFLAWGILALPWRLTIAPFVEVRTGFPFSPIGDAWNLAAPRNSGRYPVFASLDLALEQALKLPKVPPLRVGVKVFNITGRNNGRNIQPDVGRFDYGRTFNPVRRQFRASLEFVWNKG